MLRIQPPRLPECTQWPAVHTRLDLPGCAGSSTIVPEQTIGPFGLSKKIFPTGAMCRWYGRATCSAVTGRGSGSVASNSLPAPVAFTPISGEFFALASRSVFQWSLMTGLAKSDALRAHLSQFCQPPSCHFFRSSRLVGMPLGIWRPPLPWPF